MSKALRFPLRLLYWLPVLAFYCPVLAQNTQLVVQSGTTLTVSDNHLVLNNTDLHCDGAISAANATVWITGANSNSFNGAGIPLFGTLELSSASSATLTLNSNLQVGTLLNFQYGLLDLHGNQLQLLNSAYLQNEGEASRIVGATGGMVTASMTGVNAPSQLNIGNLGASLTSGANLGNVTVSRMAEPAVNPQNTSLTGIQRTYLIQPQNDAGLNATLKFYYLDAELNGEDANSLNLWKSTDGVTWQLVGADTRDAGDKYVQKAGISDFSYWTLADNANPLPVTLETFKALCDNGVALLQWQTAMESGLDDFQVESSPDGSSWTVIGKVPATNNVSGSAYSFTDEHPLSGGLYRLAIVNQSGSSIYSPIFHGGCSDVALPLSVYPNPAISQAVAQVSVRQSQQAVLLVTDINGRTVYQVNWTLQPGINQYILPVQNLSAGTYIVQLLLSGNRQQVQLIRK